MRTESWGRRRTAVGVVMALAAATFAVVAAAGVASAAPQPSTVYVEHGMLYFGAQPGARNDVRLTWDAAAGCIRSPTGWPR